MEFEIFETFNFYILTPHIKKQELINKKDIEKLELADLFDVPVDV